MPKTHFQGVINSVKGRRYHVLKELALMKPANYPVMTVAEKKIFLSEKIPIAEMIIKLAEDGERHAGVVQPTSYYDYVWSEL